MTPSLLQWNRTKEFYVEINSWLYKTLILLKQLEDIQGYKKCNINLQIS